MKTLAEFKRLVKVGTLIQAIHHLNFAGRDEQGNVIYNDKDMGTRPVSIVQSNAIALTTVKSDGTTVDSWFHYPKASECRFNEDGSFTYMEAQGNGKAVPCLTYKIVSDETTR